MSDDIERGPARRFLWGFSIATGCFLLAPILVIIITSFGGSQYMEFPPSSWSLRWYENFFTSAHWTQPALLSVQVAFVTMVGATVLGTLAAIGIVRGRFPGRKALELFVVSPMIVPIIVLAVGMYFLFSGFQLIGDPLALYLGHTVLATPLVVVVVTASLRTADPSLELAARSLGANSVRTLWYVTIPVIRPGILGGAAFAFLISFDEVVIAVFVGGPGATTLPKRMWDSIRFEIDPTLTAIASVLTLVTIMIMVGVELLRRYLEGAAAQRIDDTALQEGARE